MGIPLVDLRTRIARQKAAKISSWRTDFVENTLARIIEVVEQAAIASARWMGKGEKHR